MDRAVELERGREAYATRAWLQAHEYLVDADARQALDAPDLELLATIAYMLGLDDEAVAWNERAHHRYLEEGEPRRAARCAGWIVMNLS